MYVQVDVDGLREIIGTRIGKTGRKSSFVAGDMVLGSGEFAGGHR